ncbi:MAG: hypothetical protein U5J62_05660 [Desulfurivibrio sp.]|nr:hypothetical protein [Desulfurivibrio sp.]
MVKDFSRSYIKLRSIRGVNGYSMLGNEDWPTTDLDGENNFLPETNTGGSICARKRRRGKNESKTDFFRTLAGYRRSRKNMQKEVSPWPKKTEKNREMVVEDEWDEDDEDTQERQVPHLPSPGRGLRD